MAYEFPETMAAAKKVVKDTWAMGDALLRDIPPGAKAVDVRLQQCAEELKAEGIYVVGEKPYNAEYLGRLRNTARKFDASARVGVSLVVAATAGTPQIVEKARQIAEEDGVPLTTRLVTRVRNAANSHVKRKERKVPKPERKQRRTESSANALPVSQLRRTADVMALSSRAMNASKLGRKLIDDAAGMELTDEERDDLLEDIDQTLDTWKMAREAVKNPLSKQVEKFLADIEGA